MDTKDIIAVIILAATGLLIFFGTRGRLFTKPAPKAKSGPSATTTAGTSGGATTATPPPHPAPAPVATPRSYSWLWWLVVIALVALGWWGYKNIQPPSQVSAPPRATAPEIGITKTIEPRLRFVRSENATHQNGVILLQGDGSVNFEAEIPKRPGIRYWVKFSTLRKSDGLLLLSVNGGSRKELRYLASSSLENKVFDSRDIGTQDFREGKNFFRLSSSGDKTEIHSASIEAEWVE